MLGDVIASMTHDQQILLVYLHNKDYTGFLHFEIKKSTTRNNGTEISVSIIFF